MSRAHPQPTDRCTCPDCGRQMTPDVSALAPGGPVDVSWFCDTGHPRIERMWPDKDPPMDVPALELGSVGPDTQAPVSVALRAIADDLEAALSGNYAVSWQNAIALIRQQATRAEALEQAP